MADLIKRLEEATEGSRDLSDECLLAVGWTPGNDATKWWFNPITQEWDHPPSPSENVQDAIDWMVPEGWEFARLWSAANPKDRPWFGCDMRMDEPYKIIKSLGAATPALALCIAALKARESG